MQADRQRNFVSDNHSGICPEAWHAMAEANSHHVDAYGRDQYTEKVCGLFREMFETECEVYFAFNGTAANSLALASICRSYHSILCHQISHVETDECAAPEFYTGGAKVLPIAGELGKLNPVGVEEAVKKRTDLHFPKAKALSLTQATEVGSVYKLNELKALKDTARELGLNIHMDGARFANAVAALSCSPREMIAQAGVDVLCFGGTKNGMSIGEVIILFNNELSQEFDFQLKQAGQLCSKMRYLSAPWLGMLQEDVWLKNAKTSNAMAQRLKIGMEEMGVEVLYPVEANSVFAKLDDRLIAGMLYRGWKFVKFIAAGGCRIMCSWDTTTEDVDAFLSDMRELLGGNEDRSGEVEIMSH